MVLGYRRPDAFRGEIFVLEEMCVAPEAQGRGVGSRLLRRLHRVLEEKDIGRVVLLTIGDSPAEAFYRKSGYRRSFNTVMMVRDG